MVNNVSLGRYTCNNCKRIKIDATNNNHPYLKKKGRNNELY